MTLNTPEQWMAHALLEAKKALMHNEIPVGAVIVKDNKLIGHGFNQVIMGTDPSAHAEVVALRKAAENQQNYRLLNSDIYVTLEPCMMCLGAMIHARIRKLFFATNQPKTGIICSKGSLHKMDFLNHRLVVEGNILADQASSILKNFFKKKRMTKNNNNY